MPSLRLLPLLLAAALVPLAPRAAGAQLGARLEDAKKTDFFTFFHLEETARGPGHVDFRPKGPMFRRHVQVRVVPGPDGTIRELHLALDRDFVDEPMSGIFARDLAKSFLRFAVPGADLPGVEALADEIELPKEMPGYETATTRPRPPAPSTPSPGYGVYLGGTPSHTLRLEGSVVTLENLPLDRGAPVLLVSVVPRPR